LLLSDYSEKAELDNEPATSGVANKPEENDSVSGESGMNLNLHFCNLKADKLFNVMLIDVQNIEHKKA
jgi:hypothetical protein